MHHETNPALEERVKYITSHPRRHGQELNSTTDYFNAITEACEFIRAKTGVEKFDVSIILGSGHRKIAYERLEESLIIDFAEIPNFPIPTNIGHGRDLVAGKIHGKNVLAFTGRIHMFEGYRHQYLNWLQCVAIFLGC